MIFSPLRRNLRTGEKTTVLYSVPSPCPLPQGERGHTTVVFSPVLRTDRKIGVHFSLRGKALTAGFLCSTNRRLAPFRSVIPRTILSRFFSRLLLAAVLVLAVIVPHPRAHAEDASQKDPPPRLRVESPTVALWEVPLPSEQAIRITALTPQGDVDKTFHGPLQIEGLRITQNGEAVPPGDWKAGILEIHTDLSARRRVYVERSELRFTADGQTVTQSVLLIWKWLSLLPPLVAIVLAIWLKDVIVALLAGLFAGAVVLAGGNPFVAFLRTIDTYLLHQLVPPDGGSDHIRAVMFTLMLGGMIGVMSASGGTRALVDRLTHYAKTREHGQVLTWLLGLVVFFDDYANTLLVGSTMRSVSDRLRISREKLAFLVDSTSAPVAGLAVVSTWVGFEIGQIGPALKQLGIEADAYSVFLATIPYRFYPMLLLIFVGAVAWSGRDFGPMRECEGANGP